MVNYLFLSIILRDLKELQGGNDIIEPIAIIVAPLIINLFYTLGWLVEVATWVIFKRKIINLGPMLLRLGVGISVILLSLPTLIWACVWVLRIY